MVISFFDRVYEMVRLVPPGRVASYGQIAGLCEHPRAARTVGWALHGLTDELADPANPQAVPWWRVLNKAGRLSAGDQDDDGPNTQRTLLEAEGVVVGADDCVDIKLYGWDQWHPLDRQGA
jgi:methylated-DNA-protein-cysteine methyltransferase-like protein